jgi:hypothetical protein
MFSYKCFTVKTTSLFLKAMVSFFAKLLAGLFPSDMDKGV